MLPLDDLYSYCAAAQLEPMDIDMGLFPWPGHSGLHSAGISHPENVSRPLMHVTRLTDRVFDGNVSQYRIPSSPILPGEEERSTLSKQLSMVSDPKFQRFHESAVYGFPANNLADVVHHVIRGPLITLVTVLRALDMGTAQWNFAWDGDLPTPFAAFSLYEYKPGIRTHKLEAFVIPPWIMGLDDLQAFVAMEMVRDSAPHGQGSVDSGGPTALDSLWCMVYDRCRTKSATRFLLTTYNHWIFGKLEEDAAGVIISLSSIKHRSAVSPSLLQCLVSWTHNDDPYDVATTVSWTTDGTCRPLKYKSRKQAVVTSSKAPSSRSGSFFARSKSSASKPRSHGSSSSRASSARTGSTAKYRPLSANHTIRTGPLPDPAMAMEALDQLEEEDGEDDAMEDVDDDASRTGTNPIPNTADVDNQSRDSWSASHRSTWTIPLPRSSPQEPSSTKTSTPSIASSRAHRADSTAFEVASHSQSLISEEEVRIELEREVGSDTNSSVPEDNNTSVADQAEAHHAFEYEGSEVGSEFTIASIRTPSEALSFRSEFSTESRRQAAVAEYQRVSRELSDLIPAFPVDPMEEPEYFREHTVEYEPAPFDFPSDIPDSPQASNASLSVDSQDPSAIPLPADDNNWAAAGSTSPPRSTRYINVPYLR